METQEQEVEAFKKWWSENGKVIVIGVVAGLSAIIGWNFWQTHQQRQADVASSLYEEVVNAHNGQRFDEALNSAKAIQEQFPDSGYAALGALVGAGSAYAASSPAQARGQLQWAIENADVTEIKDVARLRLARILSAEGELEPALRNLDDIQADSFSAVIDELKGDIALAGKEREKGVEAYQRALGSDSLDPGSRRRIELKLSDLGVRPAAR